LAGLNDFEAAARHGNFHKAAAELCKTPAAVSIQIKQLEGAIGFPLFVRHARRVELTECGRELAATVSRSLAQIEDKIRLLQHQDSDALVRVSSTHSFSLKWLAPRLPGLTRQHPHLDVRVIASDELVDVDAGECDVALRHAPAGSGDALFTEWLVAVVSPSSGCKTLEAAIRLPLLHEGDTSLWEAFLESRLGGRFEAGGESRRYSHAGLLVQAACAGGGVALVPFSIAYEDVRQGRLAVLPAAPMRSSHAFQVVTGRPPVRPAVEAFLEWARGEARKMESELAAIAAGGTWSALSSLSER
jgi:LysR family glycine cleavage system transcriptional activator